MARFGIANLRYTARGKGASQKMTKAVRYYTYRDGEDKGERTWTSADGEALTPKEARERAIDLADTYGFTYQIILSNADNVDIHKEGYKQFLDAEGFEDYIFIEHSNTANNHAHVIAWRKQVISKKEIGGFLDRYDQLVEGIAAEQERSHDTTHTAELERDLFDIVEPSPIMPDPPENMAELFQLDQDNAPDFYSQLADYQPAEPRPDYDGLGYYKQAIRDYGDNDMAELFSDEHDPDFDHMIETSPDLVPEKTPQDTQEIIAILRDGLLKHEPQRHAIMESLQTYQRTGKKYNQIESDISDRQLAAHIWGQVTVAMPATAQGVSSAIVYDIDGEASSTIPAILATAKERGISAWGEIQPQLDRGYVWAVYDDVKNSRALADAGDELLHATPLSHEQLSAVDNRTDNGSVTRLPFATHRHTKERGTLMLQDGRTFDLNHQLDEGLGAWLGSYQENAADRVPETRAEATRQRIYAEVHKSIYAQKGDTYNKTVQQIKQAYNQSHDLHDIIEAHGGDHHKGRLWHCPCGCHKNNDAHASLLIVPSRDPRRNGDYIAQGYSPSCDFHADKGQVWDSFNVDMRLAGRTYKEQLIHARQELGWMPERRQPAQERQTEPTKPQAEQGDDTMPSRKREKQQELDIGY